MRCYECGYQNDETQKICVKCGTKLEGGTGPTPPPPAPKATPIDAPPASGGAKTMRGQAAQMPSWDAPSHTPPATPQAPKPAAHATTSIKCPNCQFYPLPAIPSTGSPCPNCGFAGAQGHAQGGASKTMKVGEIQLDPSNTDGPSFALVDESSGREIIFSGPQVALNRENLDPGNNSISSGTHAVFSFADGHLMVEDKSSNGATFVRASGKMPVTNGNKVVLGNKVFTVKIKS